MLKQFYTITNRDKPISNNLVERVRSLLEDYHMSEETVRRTLTANQVDLYELRNAFNMYHDNMKVVPRTGSGKVRDIRNSIYANYIPEIKEFIKNHENNYKLAKDYFAQKYGINKAFIYLVANEMGIDTRNQNIHAKNIFTNILPEILNDLKAGKTAFEIHQKFKSTGISLMYIQKLRNTYAREFLRERINYSKELKEEIVQKLKEGYSAQELSKMYNIKKKRIEDWRRTYVGYIYKQS